MMPSITFITPDEVEPGFELAGLNQQVCRSGQLEEVLETFIREHHEGILAIDERLLASLSPKSLKQFENRWEGIFVVIPAPREPAEGAEDYALEMVRRALGYHIRMTP